MLNIVTCQSQIEAIQRWARVTVSVFIFKMDVETLSSALSSGWWSHLAKQWNPSWLVLGDWATGCRPHLLRSCGSLFVEKGSLVSESALPAGQSWLTCAFKWFLAGGPRIWSGHAHTHTRARTHARTHTHTHTHTHTNTLREGEKGYEGKNLANKWLLRHYI